MPNKKIEAAASLAAADIEQQVTTLLATGQKSQIRGILTDFQNDHAERATKHWWWFFDRLIEKFHDGYRVDDFKVESINPTSVFYPLEWLYATHFFFKSPPDFNKTNWTYVKQSPTYPPKVTVTTDADMSMEGASLVGGSFSVFAWLLIIVSLVGFGMAMGIMIGQKMAIKQLAYLPISLNEH